MQIFTIIGLVSTLVATVFLYYGSKHLPWNMQTMKGHSEKEKDFYKKRQTDLTIDFVLLFAGFLLQLVAVIFN